MLADAATNKSELNERTGNNEQKYTLNFGRLVVLPSIHIGIDRYMRQKMHGIIAISDSVVHIDIFITMTRNPYWPEIQAALRSGQRVDHRSDLCDRVFRMKLEVLLKHLKEDGPFRCIRALLSGI